MQQLVNILTFIVVLQSFANTSQATEIYLDFNDASAAPGGGVTWNTVLSGSIPDLMDSTGSNTGIGFAYSPGATFAKTYGNGLVGTGASSWTDNAGLDGLGVEDLAGSEGAIFDISGLSDSAIHMIEMYISTQSSSLDMDIRIDGAFSDGNVSDNFSGQNNSTTSLVWTTVATGGDGNLRFNFVMSNPPMFTAQTVAAVNAIRITSIPEPSTGGVFVMLGLFLACRHRLIRSNVLIVQA